MKKMLVLMAMGVLFSSGFAAELIMHYDFEGDTGTTVLDKSGNDNDAFINCREGTTEATLIPEEGRNRWGTQCLSVNPEPKVANKGYLSCDLTSAVDFEGESTWILWAKHNSIPYSSGSGVYTVSTLVSWTPSKYGIMCENSQSLPNEPLDAIQVNGLTGSGDFKQNQVLLPGDGQWHFVAVKLSGTEGIYIRVDDNIYQDPAVLRTIPAGSYSRFIWGINESLLSTPRGQISGLYDDISVYKGCLTQREIDIIRYGGMAYNPSPAYGEQLVAPIDSELSWTLYDPNDPNDGVLACDVYIGKLADLSDAVKIVDNQEVDSVIVPSLDYKTYYYWRVDVYDSSDPTPVYVGPVWTFETASPRASLPSPADGTEDTELNIQLSWAAGFYGADPHKVYISDDPSAVENRTVTPVDTTEASLWVRDLDFGTTYYWAVDEVQGASIYAGVTWSFTTVDNLDTIETMTYADEAEFQSAWACDKTDPNLWANLVSGTMRLDYSDGTRTLTKLIGPDDEGFGFSDAWILQLKRRFMPFVPSSTYPGVTISLLDASDNVLFSSAVEPVTSASLVLWQADLTAVRDTLTDIRKIRLAVNEFTDCGGFAYFDDIAFAIASCPGQSGDINGDCVVDINDMSEFATAWLDCSLVPNDGCF